MEEKLPDANFLIWYWRALGTRARLQRANGQSQEALQTMTEVGPLMGRGIALSEREKRDDATIALRVERARSRHFLSQQLYKPGMLHLDRPDEALAELKAARTELMELDTLHPDPEITYLLGSVDGQTAIVHEARDALEPALRAAELAMAARHASVKALPQDVEYLDALVTESTNLGRILLRLQRHDAALAATTAAWDLNRQLQAEHAATVDNNWTRRAPLLATHHGRALRRAGQPAAALPVLEMALSYWQRMAATASTNQEALRGVAWMQAERAQAMQALGLQQGARATASAAFRAYQPPPHNAYQQRAGYLVQAQLAMAMAEASKGVDVTEWKSRARSALDAAAAIAPLAGEHRAWMQTLS
jgi:tetratricopeptide (TPR) repeat protein